MTSARQAATSLLPSVDPLQLIDPDGHAVDGGELTDADRSRRCWSCTAGWWSAAGSTPRPPR